MKLQTRNSIHRYRREGWPVNPTYMRYELHRVWIVEGAPKPGQSHIYAKRNLLS
ncbi:MAG: DUF1329 domain-containing protein [Rhodocyclaceae bacterium]|nr:DUF1329 domain-containing protein [Rhodocyclaceae bacterium]